jgi:hypothetical protein
MSILSTMSLGLLAISISLGALYLATKPFGGSGMTSVLILAWVMGGFGLIFGIVFFWWGLYLWRHPNKPSIEESFRRINRSLTKISEATTKDIPNAISQSSQNIINELGNRFDKITEQQNEKQTKSKKTERDSKV